MKRYKHSLSHYKLTTMNMGQLVPIMCKPVLPGDTWQQSTNALIRVAPLLAPVMHPTHVYVHHYFVPNRILWDKWEDFITGGPDGLDSSAFPTLDAQYTTPGTLADHLGVPPLAATNTVSALPFRAYAKIFNECYRDQDLQTELVVSTGSGNDTTTNTTLQNVTWGKDYFTTARPWQQKGPQLTIPMGGTAPVLGIGLSAPAASANQTNIKQSDGTTVSYTTGWRAASVQDGALSAGQTLIGIDEKGTGFPGIYADMDQGSGGADPQELRTVMALLRYQEARARYGSRFVEYLRYLGVKSSDARLQRPEYLGGGKQTIQFSEVLQTGVTTDGDDAEGVGNMRGHGIGAMRSNRYRRFFEEHGFVITLMFVRPIGVYNNNIDREWLKRTKEEFWQRELQHVGAQMVTNREVFAGHLFPDDPFGYVPMYDEYRGNLNGISGEFRTTALDYWTQARIFSGAPALNASFVSCVPTDRIYASTTTDQLYVFANHSIQARRLVSNNTSTYLR